jgi:hypothetical protein
MFIHLVLSVGGAVGERSKIAPRAEFIGEPLGLARRLAKSVGAV